MVSLVANTSARRAARSIAQDEATSVVWGMPGAVAQAGLANKILPLHEIATEINRRVGQPTLSISAYQTASLAPAT